jgi:predicted transcriptional regulator
MSSKREKSSSPKKTKKKLAYTIKEFAKSARISVSMVYKALDTGELTAKKWGGRTLVLHAVAVEFLNDLPDYKPGGGRKGS